MKAIGIDIGTTSICGTVIDVKTGRVLQSRTENSNAFIKTENSWEKIQDPQKIISIATNILDEFITEDISVIGVTGQMHGIVYTDKEGKAVSELYTWQDERGNKPYKEGKTYSEYLKTPSGYGNVTDFYNRENGLRPESAVNFCTIHDYLVMTLCGLKKAVIHPSNAASFGAFDLKINKTDYHSDIEVADGFVIAGEYKGIPVSLAIGDNQASVLSSITENDVLINVGTGSQISVISSQIKEGIGIETRPYFDGKYLIVGSALCGGRAYAILRDFYSKIFSYKAPLNDGEIYDIMDKMASSAASPLKVDTRFSGTRADESIRGGISGISTENFTPEALTKGVLEGIIDELLSMYSLMGEEKGSLVGSGNGIRKNKSLVNVAENKLSLKMKIPQNTEEAAVGAAIYACVSAGLYKSLSDAEKVVLKYV